jgi:outer membrane lipoprotein-sorting protein
MRRSLWGVVLGVATVVSLPSSASAETADEILARADRLTNGWDDVFMRTTMTVTDIDGSRKSYVYSIAQKGAKRLIRFESGELKGIATLVIDREHVYAYLPGLKKVRRVAAHNMNQTFAGSDFSNDDFAFTSWTSVYRAAIDREDADHWYLLCTPKPGGPRPPYPKVIARVVKKSNQLVGYDAFDESGQKVKTFDFDRLKDWGGGVIRTEVIVVTNTRTGHETRLDLTEFRVNQGLPDSLFTERELVWGR